MGTIANCGLGSKRPHWSANGGEGCHGDGLLRNQSQTDGPADFRRGDGTTRPHRPDLRRGHRRRADARERRQRQDHGDHPRDGYRLRPATRQAILGSGKDLLVFIHGFANAFEAAISRAAFNREWFASSTVAGADMTVLAFSWPSAGALIAVPPHFLSGAYRADQARAGSSGAHLAWFLDEVKIAARRGKAPEPRDAASYCSRTAWAISPSPPASKPGSSAAAPRRFSTTPCSRQPTKSTNRSSCPPARRLSRLDDLAAGISVYYSLRDVAMFLSQAINLTERLGFDGPAHKSNTTLNIRQIGFARSTAPTSTITTRSYPGQLAPILSAVAQGAGRHRSGIHRPKP